MKKGKTESSLLQVLIITSSFPHIPYWFDGGFLWKKAVSLRKKGISVIVLCPHRPGAPLFEKREGVIIHRFPYLIPFRAQKLTGRKGMNHVINDFPLLSLELIPFLISSIIHAIYLTLRYRPDIIHSHWIIPNGIVGACINAIFHIPHISSVHGSDVTISASCHLFSRLIQIVAGYTQSITANSSFTRKKLSMILPNHTTFRVIPMGIHCEPSSIVKVVPNSGTNMILYVGRLIDWKGVHVLISAMKNVSQIVKTARLVIVGDGPRRENLISQVKKLDLEEIVTFAGEVPDAILQDYYARAAVFVLPSTTVNNQTEGLGVVLLEAMAAGVPVIGSNAGGIPDIIQDGINGLLFPQEHDLALATAIIRILSDTILADRLRERGFRTVQDHFSWDSIGDQFVEEYLTIIRS